MNFFKSVFSDDPEPSDLHNTGSPSKSQPVEEKEEEEPSLDDNPNPNPSPDPNPSNVSSTWSFGGLIQTLASRSESVIQTYRRDLEEFGSGLKKETAVIREVASRAVKDLPASLEVGASVAQGSLESVGQAIDDFGSSVWRGTAEIISHGITVDQDTDSSSDNNYNIDNSNQRFNNQGLNSNRYSRFDAQLRSIQGDTNTYSEEPDDLDDYNKWKLGFLIDEKREEIESLIEENVAVEGIYRKLVPSTIDFESFWSRYFYRVYKLKQAEDARAKLVKRAISGEEEDLSWDVDDDEEESNGLESKSDLVKNREDSGELATENKNVEIAHVGTVETGEKSSKMENNDKGIVAESIINNAKGDEKLHLEGKSDLSEANSDTLEAKFDEKMVGDGKTGNGESCKDSDISIVSSQPSLPEEEDLGWDEIEDIGSNDESKVSTSGSPNKVDLRKRLSTAEEEEDLSWDIEDDDEPVKS